MSYELVDGSDFNELSDRRSLACSLWLQPYGPRGSGC